jgi:hypothetical protein
MNGVVPIVLALGAFAFAGCGNNDSKTATPQVQTVDSSIESAINRACGDGRIITIAMATRKQYAGSKTDYWLVLCQFGARAKPYVVRIEV